MYHEIWYLHIVIISVSGIEKDKCFAKRDGLQLVPIYMLYSSHFVCTVTLVSNYLNRYTS